MGLLDNRIVLLTGGASGVGQALAERCLAEGATLINADVANVNAHDERLRTVQIDITSEAAVTMLVREIEAEHGRIDVLYNCAGVIGQVDAVQDMSMESWRQVFEVNVFGTVLMCQVVLPLMLAKGGGKIVNTASSAQIEIPTGQSAYNASKAAVATFTKSIARELHVQNIRANCIDPGGVRTEMIERFIAEDVRGRPVAEQLQVEFRNFRDAGNLREAVEVTDPYIFLASTLGDTISGQLLRVSMHSDPGINAA